MLTIDDKRRSFTYAQKVGYLLRLTRHRAKLKQETVAIEAGISRTHLSHIERGQVDVSLSVLLCVVTAIGTKMGAFFAELEELIRELG